MSVAATVPSASTPAIAATRPAAARAPRSARIGALALGLCALAVLVTAALLTPDPSGMGTHRGLGLPACGWLAATRYPCPTCGMTTSFAYAAHGRPLDALRAQPFGALLALATAVFFWGAMHIAVFGSHLGRIAERFLGPRWLWPTGTLFLAAWAYKCWQVRTGR